MRTIRKPFLIKRPAWVHTKEGYTDKVPAPWTPVKVIKEKGELKVSVWGRTYTFGKTPFLVQVKSAKKDLLAEPFKLDTTINGSNSNWQFLSQKLVSSDNKSCVIKQSFVNKSPQARH